MRHFAIVLLGLTSLVSARPAFLSVPLTYATLGTQVNANGEPLDSPEAAAARRERVNLANEAARSTVPQVRPLPRERQSSLLVNDAGVPPVLVSSAPLGADGRVIDTPEVAAARAAHAAAHVNEKITLANEAAKSGGAVLDSSEDDDVVTTPEAVIGPDGRILDTPEVAAARAAHAAAHVNEKLNLANEAARSDDVLTRVVDGSLVPFVLRNGVVAALVPVSPDVGLLDAPEVVAIRGNQNVANDVKSVDALAVAGSALAYGRFVY